MQKRSHKRLAETLLREYRHSFSSRRSEWAFLFGSFQPDCNPFTYLWGMRRTRRLQGHSFVGARDYIESRICRLQHCERWGLRHYYMLGKLTHYLADAFTYPHNDHFGDTMMNHHRYERTLRRHLAERLSQEDPGSPADKGCELFKALDMLHREYSASRSSVKQDAGYILQATRLLMAGCCPVA